jgi:succinyl-diaminopimelate desuccinylase
MALQADVDALARTTLDLCAIPSPTGEESALAEHVEAWARRHWQPSERVRVGHSFVLGRRDDARPTVALVGHLDTVPAHPDTGAPRRSGDRLLATGASDMKGGVAVMMALAESLPRERLASNLLLVLYEREEGPYAESGLGPLFVQVPELQRVRFAVALEPTDGAVQVGCVGSLHATLRFRGRAAHAARPWQGVNALHLAGPVLADLLALGPRQVDRGGFLFREVMTATLGHGGRARNVVPDLFELNVNVRFAPGRTAEDADADLRQLVAGRAEVEVTDRSPSAPVCATNPFFERLVQATGRPATAKQAWTDVARFAAQGVDAVNFGPGETAQAHQAGESASVSALGAAYDALATFLLGPTHPSGPVRT